VAGIGSLTGAARLELGDVEIEGVPPRRAEVLLGGDPSVGGEAPPVVDVAVDGRVGAVDLEVAVGEDPTVDGLGRSGQVELDRPSRGARAGACEDRITTEERLLLAGAHRLRDDGQRVGSHTRRGESGVVDLLDDDLVLGGAEGIDGHHDIRVVVVVAVLGGDG